MATHEDDLFGAEQPGGDHCGQSDHAVTDDGDGDGVAGVDAGGVRGVVAGAEHVGECEQVGQQRGALSDGHLDQGAVCLRDTGGLALAAVDAVHAPLAAVQAGGLQALAAVRAGVVSPDE